MTKTDYELGRSDGYCCIEPRYPNNVNYMTGHKSGERRAENEWRDNQSDSVTGTNDANFDCHYC
jgi:hypothetical protein